MMKSRKYTLVMLAILIPCSILFAAEPKSKDEKLVGGQHDQIGADMQVAGSSRPSR